MYLKCIGKPAFRERRAFESRDLLNLVAPVFPHFLRLASKWIQIAGMLGEGLATWLHSPGNSYVDRELPEPCFLINLRLQQKGDDALRNCQTIIMARWGLRVRGVLVALVAV